MPVRPRILAQPAFCVPVVRETPRPAGTVSGSLGLVRVRVGTGTRTAGRLLPPYRPPCALAESRS